MEKALDSWREATRLVQQTTKNQLDAAIALAREITRRSYTTAGSQTIGAIIEELRLCQQFADMTLKQLTSGRDLINNIIELLTNMLPLKQLPEQVLRRIFILACSSTRCAFDRESTDPIIVIPAVCKRWREIALGTASLWSHIDVDLDRYTARSQILRGHSRVTPPFTVITDKYVSHKTEFFLRRAQGRPFDVHFRFAGEPDAAQDLARLFKPYASHINSLVFSHAAIDTILDAMLTLCTQNNSLGALNKVAIYRGMLYTREYHFSWAQFPLRRLTILKLRHMCNRYSYLKMNELLSMLSENPSLRVLQLNITTITLDELDETPTVFLPNLEHLDISEMSDNEVLVSLLLALTVGTKELRLMIGLTNDPDLYAATCDFFQRANIVAFGFQDASLQDGTDNFDRYLEKLPHLTSLLMNIDGNWHVPLIPTEGSGAEKNRWPSLKTLYLLSYGSNRIIAEHLKEVVQSLSLNQITLVYPSRSHSRDPDVILSQGGFMDKGSADDPSLVEWLTPRVARFDVKMLDLERAFDWDDVLEASETFEHDDAPMVYRTMM
ncbi:pyrolysin [Ceratobasidium sp. AG-Ba]|nr:pyrolysin [Ceratobasidium sp. AG-Ba]QRW02574.1 pyrolysin [Ceratobasidium sp. AG-Ba]